MAYEINHKMLVFAGILVLLSGCATYASGPLFKEAPLPSNDMGTLYVFRSKASLGALVPTVKIDRRPFVKLTAMGYSYTYLSPGVYRLTFENGNYQRFITEIEIKEGQELFIEYSEPFSTLREIPKSQVSDVVKNYRYVAPVSSWSNRGTNQ
ncbi:MAG: hypothetical protein Q8O22_06910 [Candidatus Omnitrophota bacterium]|nr:hypothetical protein [Candidatus Omnitrophota bacterium]